MKKPKPPTTTIRLIFEIEVVDSPIDYPLAVESWGAAESAEEAASYRQSLVHEQQLADLIKERPEWYRQQLINNLMPFLHSLGDLEVHEKLQHGEDDTLLTKLVTQLPQEAQDYFTDSNFIKRGGGAEVLVEGGQHFSLRRVSVEDASGTILSSDDAPPRKKRYGRR